MLALGCGTPPPEEKVELATPAPPSADTVQAAPADPDDVSAAGDLVIKGEDVLLPNGQRYPIGLHAARILDRFPRPGAAPLLLVQGRPLKERNTPESLYFIDVDRPLPSWADGANAWHAAGSMSDTRHKEAFYTADVFSGEVLPGTTGVIWYERILQPNGQWTRSTTLLQVEGTRVDTSVYFGHEQLPITQRRAFKGLCKVVPPVDQRLPS